MAHRFSRSSRESFIRADRNGAWNAPYPAGYRPKNSINITTSSGIVICVTLKVFRRILAPSSKSNLSSTCFGGLYVAHNVISVNSVSKIFISILGLHKLCVNVCFTKSHPISKCPMPKARGLKFTSRLSQNRADPRAQVQDIPKVAFTLLFATGHIFRWICYRTHFSLDSLL